MFTGTISAMTNGEALLDMITLLRYDALGVGKLSTAASSASLSQCFAAMSATAAQASASLDPIRFLSAMESGLASSESWAPMPRVSPSCLPKSLNWNSQTRWKKLANLLRLSRIQSTSSWFLVTWVCPAPCRQTQRMNHPSSGLSMKICASAKPCSKRPRPHQYRWPPCRHPTGRYRQRSCPGRAPLSQHLGHPRLKRRRPAAGHRATPLAQSGSGSGLWISGTLRPYAPYRRTPGQPRDQRPTCR